MIDSSFILSLRNLGVVLRVEGDRLLCNAPKGVLTPELLNEIRENKNAILEIIKGGGSSAETSLPELVKSESMGHAPMTFAQQRLWFLDQLQPGTPAYNMSWALEITGELDCQALVRGFNEVVLRHEVLRTGFRTKENKGWQFIRDTQDFQIVYVDVADIVTAPDSESLLNYLKDESNRPFDLSADPLVRVKLIRMSDQQHILFVIIHHIIFDGWSFDIFIKELFTLYITFHEGKPTPLPEMKLQYSDYAFWQHNYLNEAELSRQLEFWKRRLGGELSQLDIPTDYPRPREKTSNGAQVKTFLDKDVVQAAREIVQKGNASLFMVMLAAFKVLLHRLSGQTDIVIGSPFAGRRIKETEALIGFFVNTVVLRMDLSGDPSFSELLGRVREMVLEAQEFQDMPFEQVVEALAPRRDLSRTPLFQVFFNHVMSQLPQQDDHLDIHLKVFEGYQGEVESKFDLTLYVEEIGSSIRLRMVYNSDLFSEDRAAVMLDQYEGLIAQVVSQPERRISSYSLDHKKDCGQLPDLSEPLKKDWAGSVTQKVTHWAQVRAQAIALEDPWGSFSYGELEQFGNRLSQRLAVSGIESGDVVAVYGHRSAGIVIALLGIMKVGAAFLILDPGYPAERLLRMIEDARPRGLIALEAAGAVDDQVVNLWQATSRWTIPSDKRSLQTFLEGEKGEPLPVAPDPDKIAYIIFTSGTTGRPKGIVGTQRPLGHFLQWHCKQFGLKESDRFSMLSGLSHDPLLRDMFAPLWAGARLCIPETDDLLMPMRLRAWMRTKEISVAHMTPSLGNLLAAEVDEDLPELRYVFFGGETLSRKVVDKIRNLAPRAYCVNFYGTTETPQAMGYHVVDPIADSRLTQRIAIGRGIEGAQLVVMNAYGKPAGVGELGEIHVRSPYLAQGYLNDDELTKQKYLVNPYGISSQDKLYRTGDLGRYQPDGQVIFHGRRDRQVSIRGFRVELHGVESVLLRHPAVKECTVAKTNNPDEESAIGAFIVMADNENCSKKELREYLKRYLPFYMIPSALILIEKIPLTPNGKIDYAALQRLSNDMADTGREDVPQDFGDAYDMGAPSTEMEKVMVEIWQKALNTTSVSVNDNFYDIGGHSLLTVEVASMVKERLRVELNPREFIYQTLGQMATMLEDRLKEHSNEKDKIKNRGFLNFFKEKIFH